MMHLASIFVWLLLRSLQARNRRIEGQERKLQVQREFKMQQIRLKAVEDKAKEAERKLWEKEEREKSSDERLSELLLAELEKKLEQVDERLESLQDDVWEEEEESMETEGLEEGFEDCGSDDDKAPVCEVTKVLLLVLPSSARRPGLSNEALGKLMMEQREEILAEWKAEFGRLPIRAQVAAAPQDDGWVEKDDGDGEVLTNGARGHSNGDTLGLVKASEIDSPDNWEDLVDKGDVDVDVAIREGERKGSDDDDEELETSTPQIKIGGTGFRPGGKYFVT